MTSFQASACLTLAMLAAVIVAAAVVPNEAGSADTLANRAIAKFNATRHVTMTREEAAKQVEGYYEGLFQQSSRAVAVSALVSGGWTENWTAWESVRLRKETARHTNNFLYYELLPNVDVPERKGRLVTNSFGMADREYPKERRPGYRRVAFIGDSMTRGLGSSPGANYESLLENFFNELRPAGESVGYEFLNFGVEGYRVTQMVEVALTKAADFSPDCFVVVLTDLGVARKWADHLGQLVSDGIDLQYEFLEEVVRRARVRPTDDAVTIESKLEPYRMAILRWALVTIRDFAAEQNADTIALLVPAVTHRAGELFSGVPELLESVGIPTIDLLDTFEGIDDLAALRNGARDHHPTDAGHKVLFERLVAKLEVHSEVRLRLTGTAGPPDSRSALARVAAASGEAEPAARNSPSR